MRLHHFAGRRAPQPPTPSPPSPPTFTFNLHRKSMKLKTTEELITFLQSVQAPSSPMSQHWHELGAVSAAVDWDTFNDLREVLGDQSKYSYRIGVLTLEPPRSHFPATSSKCPGTFPTSRLALKASILAHLQASLAPYTHNGTASGLAPVVRTNVGRTLTSGAQGNVYRTADLYIGVSAANNLDTAYDALPARDAALVVDVVIGGAEESEEAARGVSEWLKGDKEVRQVVVFHVDFERILRCREKGRGLRLRDSEQIGSVRRWGRDTKGGTVLLEEMRVMYHYAGYTDTPVMLVDFARALGVPVPQGEKLTIVLDWNHALASINVAHNESHKTNLTLRAGL